MIKTFWDSATSLLQRNSPYAKASTNLAAGPMQITSAAAESGILLRQIDMADVQNVGDYLTAELEIQNPPASNPAAGQTVTIWAACSSSGSKQPAELKTAASSLVCALQQVPGQTNVYMMPVLYMAARYLYIWFDHTGAGANGVPLNLRLRVNAKTG